MSEEESRDLIDRVVAGLKISYENLLRRKAALGQDMVFADENGLPRVVPAKQVLEEYLLNKSDR